MLHQFFFPDTRSFTFGPFCPLGPLPPRFPLGPCRKSTSYFSEKKWRKVDLGQTAWR